VVWAVVGAAVVLTAGIFYGLATYHQVPQVKRFKFTVTTPGDASSFHGQSESYCPLSNSLGNGYVSFTWYSTSGNATVEITGPAPANPTVYNSGGTTHSGYYYFSVLTDGATGCGIYFFGIRDSAPNSAVIDGYWSYTLSEPLL
jgi:hypothetical protein